jgi:PIN domain
MAKVIVTHQLETEFKKNRQQVILKSVKLLGDHVPKRVPSVGVLAQAKQFKMLGKDVDKAKKRIQNLQSRLIEMIQEPTKKDPVFKAVSRVFHRNDDDLILTRETKDDEKRKSVRERAERRFMHGCPPRKSDDTSYGDALNWEWMIDCAKAKDGELVIVSRDADYGSTHDGKSYINDHLRHEFSARVSRKRGLLLYTKLSDALTHFNVAVTQAQVNAEKQLIDDDEPTFRPADPDEFEVIEQ